MAADTVPVDLSGKCGDVIFWHHRTAHMAGQNHSGNIRQAVLYDYIKKAEFYDDGPPPSDMWRDWSPQLRALCGADEELSVFGSAALTTGTAAAANEAAKL
eukprot:SAG22_NODE_1509_length_4263_cov_194.143612_3_plen_101_part_00